MKRRNAAKGFSNINCINYGHVPNRFIGFGRMCLRCGKGLPTVLIMGGEAAILYDKTWDEYFKSKGFTQKEIDDQKRSEKDDMRVDEKGVEEYRKKEAEEMDKFYKSIISALDET